MPGQPANGPDQQDSGNAPGGVDDHVGDSSFAMWNKKLVNFVAGGVQRDQQNRPSGIGPSPGFGIMADRFTEGAKEQPRQYRVLGQMRTLADDKNDLPDCPFSQLRKQPADYWLQNAGRMLKGMRIAGSRKNNGHPHQHRRPIIEE